MQVPPISQGQPHEEAQHGITQARGGMQVEGSRTSSSMVFTFMTEGRAWATTGRRDSYESLELQGVARHVECMTGLKAGCTTKEVVVDKPVLSNGAPTCPPPSVSPKRSLNCRYRRRVFHIVLDTNVPHQPCYTILPSRIQNKPWINTMPTKLHVSFHP